MAQPLLEIKNLSKHYFSKTKTTYALNDVSFELHAGEVVALLGANGAGKTTLSALLATLHPPTSGDILYGGQSIYKHLNYYRRKLGYCPQRPNLNALMTLRDNLVFAGRFYGLEDQQIEASLAKLTTQLDLQDYLDARSGVLSGGWRQRFMIARSLVHEPSLVLLDEPTVGLDPHIRRQLWDVIRTLKNNGITTILTTHYLDEAETLADRVIILDHGKIKLIDEPRNLKTNFKLPTLEAVFLQLMQEEPA